MKLLGYVYILGYWIQSAYPLPVLVQTPREILAAEDEKIELSCNLKGASLAQVFWYKVEHNQTTSFVKSANVLNRQAQGDGITERFVLNRDGFRLTFTLTIKDLKLTDNGTYYCLMMMDNSRLYFGAGSVLTVVPEREKVTSPPLTTTTTRRRKSPNRRWNTGRNNKANNNGYVCSWAIWGSLLVFNLLLLSSTVAIVIHCRRRNSRRRCPHQFRKR